MWQAKVNPSFCRRVIHSSLSTVTGFTANLSSSYESHLELRKDGFYVPALASVDDRRLASGTVCPSLLFMYNTYRSSALLARAIFLTTLNIALTEIPEHFPTP